MKEIQHLTRNLKKKFSTTTYNVGYEDLEQKTFLYQGLISNLEE